MAGRERLSYGIEGEGSPTRSEIIDRPFFDEDTLDYLRAARDKLGGLFSSIGSGIRSGAESLANNQDTQLLASGINDYLQRNIKGRLAATDAAVAPFTSFRAADAFSKGSGGFDLPEKLAQRKLASEKAKERSRYLDVLENIYGRSAPTKQKLSEQQLKDLDVEYNKLKGLK